MNRKKVISEQNLKMYANKLYKLFKKTEEEETYYEVEDLRKLLIRDRTLFEDYNNFKQGLLELIVNKINRDEDFDIVITEIGEGVTKNSEKILYKITDKAEKEKTAGQLKEYIGKKLEETVVKLELETPNIKVILTDILDYSEKLVTILPDEGHLNGWKDEAQSVLDGFDDNNLFENHVARKRIKSIKQSVEDIEDTVKSVIGDNFDYEEETDAHYQNSKSYILTLEDRINELSCKLKEAKEAFEGL